MRIDELLGKGQPTISFEFFPPMTDAVGDKTELVLAVLGHNQRMNTPPGAGAGITDIALKLRNQPGSPGHDPLKPRYRVIRVSEFDMDNPQINWNGTGPVYNWALNRLQSNRGILRVGVIGYSHGAHIAKRVAERMNQARVVCSPKTGPAVMRVFRPGWGKEIPNVSTQTQAAFAGTDHTNKKGRGIAEDTIVQNEVMQNLFTALFNTY